LSQLAIRSEDKAGNAKEIHHLLLGLLSTWQAQGRKDAAVMDGKLADYVFFPVSHVLRNQDLYPMMVIETIIKLLKDLIELGWKSGISKDLSQQLLIFLSFIIGGTPGQPRKRAVPEETVLEAYRTLRALVTATGTSTSASASFLEDKMVPTLGHSVSVILDGVTDGTTPEIQLAALECLNALYTGIKDHAVLASFLPGTVSSLTRALAPPASLKTPTRVLIRGLQVLQIVLSSVLGDMKTRNILKDMKEVHLSHKSNDAGPVESSDVGPETNGASKALTPSWLRATASQIKIALSSVLKLRTHESQNVQNALHKFCIALLDECHKSLAECQTILVESAMMLQQEDDEAKPAAVETSLEDLASIYPELGDTIRSVMYNWVTGLPRMMQSSEERVKQQAIRNFLRGNKLVAKLELNSTTLEDSIADALKDSVVTLMVNSKQQSVINEDVDENPLKAVTVTTSTLAAREYRPVILALDGQRSTRKEITSLVASIGSPAQHIKLASEMLSYLRDSEGVEQIASFWLSFELVKASYSNSSADDLDNFLDLTTTTDSRQQETVFHELYDFSATIVASHSDIEEVDWRLEAIALEVTAFAALRLQMDFRPELIDVLYPITTFMGSQNAQLRNHAITTLSIITTSCGYDNVSDLIIDNVDYMLNSLALRLNTFDISPASIRVLNMMIGLSGPQLIPFLDDVVASIFAALDNYHGYPLFVESLFSVLSEVVEQGAKSDKLLLEGDPLSKKIDHKKKPPQSDGIEGLIPFLDKHHERNTKDEHDDLPQNHPKQPWGPPKDKSPPKSFLDTLDEINPAPPSDNNSPPEEEEEEDDQQHLDTPNPPPTPTYTLLSRITTLTQHHLTSPSPTLRRRLLDLLSRAAPALAADEDAFLPLVAAVWPVVAARLRDGEPFVVVAACDALCALCESAGDFLVSRVKTEWGEWMGRWCGRARDMARGEEAVGGRKKGRAGRSPGLLGRSYGAGGNAGTSSGGDILLPTRGGIAAVEQQPAMLSSTPMEDLKLVQGGNGGGSSTVAASRSSASTQASGLGRFSQASQVWSAVVRLLTAIASYVRLDDGIFDQIVELLVDVVPSDEKVRGALEDVNADAVWLALYERGRVRVDDIVVPAMEGVKFVGLVTVG
jgi:hypothetical protein